MQKTAVREAKPANSKSHSSVFITMALDMSWRLAVAVLVPIIGGFKLDEKLNSAPLLAILGFILAMGGMALVMRRTLKVTKDLPIPKVTYKNQPEDDD
jgi:F0F1-type ATP synthase assembly protein I